MELPPGAARRTNYSLLSQFPADAAGAGPGPGPAPASALQRQSSGSSYGGGSSVSASSDYPFHLPPPASAAAGPGSAAAAPGGSSPCKSWAQQAEETYQLQLALALRLCADAACAVDPGFLDPGDPGSGGRGSGNGRAFPLAQPAPSAESLSHRFWVSSLITPSPFPPVLPLHASNA